MPRTLSAAASERGGPDLAVGQLAQRSGVAISTIHFYERKGLIRSLRTHGNQRRFPRETLRRVTIIKIAQRVGIPLNAIREIFDSLPSGRAPTARDWAHLAANWRSELEERIRRLSQLRDDLDGCIGCGCLSLHCCPLYNPNDKLASEGPGARLLA
jgi:MerR family transcriptional regulator, redox-sensitive transcriptional activator SoxR